MPLQKLRCPADAHLIGTVQGGGRETFCMERSAADHQHPVAKHGGGADVSGVVDGVHKGQVALALGDLTVRRPVMHQRQG